MNPTEPKKIPDANLGISKTARQWAYHLLWQHLKRIDIPKTFADQCPKDPANSTQAADQEEILGRITETLSTLAALEEARIVIQLQNHGSCLPSVEDAIEMIEREIY